MTLYILKYNNYYNRILKREQDLEDYLNYEIFSSSGTTFNPNDGVNTTHILGGAESYSGEGDYLIVASPRGEIVSRWFIIDAKRVRAGQYNLTLRRDLFVDYWDKLVDAPAFIEKATLPDSSPFIYNSEQMTVNQIKTGELLIKDKTQCPWIVGYYAKNTPTEHLQGNVAQAQPDADLVVSSLESWEYYPYLSEAFIGNTTNQQYRIYGHNYVLGISGYYTYNNEGQRETSETLDIDTQSDIYFVNGANLDKITYITAALGTRMQDDENIDRINSSALAFGLNGEFFHTANEEEEFNELQGITIATQDDGKFYEVKIVKETTNARIETYFPEDSAPFKAMQRAVIQAQRDLLQDGRDYGFTGVGNNYSYKAVYFCPSYKITLTPRYDKSVQWDMSATKITTDDAPYDVFAIPVGKVNLKTLTGEIICTSEEDPLLPFYTAASIIANLSPATETGFLYDVQLVPYCPVYVDETRAVSVSTTLEYSLIKGPEINGVRTPISFILNVPRARFSRYINLSNPITWYNKKIDNECNLYKLCSPNWASEFQISPTKNDGIRGFDVDCEYKPYQPYIHIAPRFSGLYGADFNDARGLICAGDFSLSQIGDKWQEYQINNKNFQLMFDRDIQNMEVQHKHQRIQQGIGMLGGTFGGAMQGSITGGQTGGGYGAAIGAVAGGVSSAAGGVLDYYMSEQLRNEALDYKQDMFGYQLDNIKALPYTLTKVSAFNQNNKLFPVLEYYTCTEEEKIALANKIAYNGMTVGVIGTIGEYINNNWRYWNNKTQSYITDKGYIKGQLIRLDDFGEDYHIVNELAGEFNKGVYTK